MRFTTKQTFERHAEPTRSGSAIRSSHADNIRRAAHRIEPAFEANQETIDRAWTALLAETQATDADRAILADERSLNDAPHYSANIENFIGTVKVPLGVIGPLTVRGRYAVGDYFVPLATSEAALVASYGRGGQVIAHSGGVTAALLSEGVTRAPAFTFGSVDEAVGFSEWVLEKFEWLQGLAESTTRFGKLVDIEPFVEGRHVHLVCRYTTGDAAGQNMATFATDVMCGALLDACPIAPTSWFLDGNMSGDKKACARSFVTGRGRKVTASVTIDAEVAKELLHTSIEQMFEFWQTSVTGSAMSGAFGAQGHFANGLAALFIATGQDAACVSESAVGLTRLELDGRNLIVSVTLPNLMVGTVGGGTSLPCQSAGLRIMGLDGPGNAGAFAEVAAALCLAGEISIIGAFAAGHFGQAHHNLARNRR